LLTFGPVFSVAPVINTLPFMFAFLARRDAEAFSFGLEIIRAAALS